ncbi:hypothetical protein ACWGJT_04085 [Streptomyces xantholiticus]
MQSTDQWPTIAAAVSPEMPEHVHALAFDAHTGQLDLRYDSPAYATLLRMATNRRIQLLNDAVSSSVVQSIRLLPASSTAPSNRPADLEATIPRAREAAPRSTVPKATSAGYQRTLRAHQLNRRTATDDPAIRAARARQAREQAREPEELFGDGQTAVAELRARAARSSGATSLAVSRARALQRVAAERAARDAAANHRVP